MKKILTIVIITILISFVSVYFVSRGIVIVSVHKDKSESSLEVTLNSDRADIKFGNIYVFTSDGDKSLTLRFNDNHGEVEDFGYVTSWGIFKYDVFVRDNRDTIVKETIII